MTMPPFNDMRVRKAFSYALSRDVIANFHGQEPGGADLLPGPVPARPGRSHQG